MLIPIYVEKKGGPKGPPQTASVGTAGVRELRENLTLPLMPLCYLKVRSEEGKKIRRLNDLPPFLLS